MPDKKDKKLDKVNLEAVAADATAAGSSISQSSNIITNGTNDKKIKYTAEEQELADRLNMLVGETDRSWAAEEKAWCEVWELMKEKGGRLREFAESLGADKDRVYSAIRGYEASLVKAAAAKPIPPSIEEEAIKIGIDLSRPDQRNAVARAIGDAKLTGTPTHKQVISIVKTASDDIDAAADGKKGLESERGRILASLNDILTSSYQRVVGIPEFEQHFEKRFVGYTKPNGVFVPVADCDCTEEEEAWGKMMEEVFKISGDLVCNWTRTTSSTLEELGRGEDYLE